MSLRDPDNKLSGPPCGWVAGKIKGVASGLWDRYSGRATKGAGAAGEGSIKAVATNSKFPETGFSTEINSGRGITQFNTSFKGVDNNGVLQTTFTKNTGDLYIDVIRSEVQREGLGEAMLRKTIAEVESKAGPVKTLSGNLEGVNRTEFLKGGLESTPAYKQRQALGFTEVIVTPSKENGFTLVMRKPG